MMQDTPSRSLSDSELRALVEVVLLVAYADGSLAPVELDTLVKRVHGLSGGSLDRAAIEGLVHEVKPIDPLLKAVRAKRLANLAEILGHNGHKQVAFQVALEVAKADGRIGHREVSTLASAASEFGLDSASVLELLARVQNAEV